MLISLTFYAGGCASTESSKAVAPMSAASSTLAMGESCLTPTKTLSRIFVAQTEDEKAQGLMGRRQPLNSDEGMLFVFEHPQSANFWMKNTFIPLQVAYFDYDKKLVEFYDMPVESDPTRPVHRYPSSHPVYYALEVAPGTFNATDVETGLVFCSDQF